MNGLYVLRFNNLLIFLHVFAHDHFDAVKAEELFPFRCAHAGLGKWGVLEAQDP